MYYLCSQQLSQGKPTGDGATVTTTQQNLRALDALTCVAAEKQVSITGFLLNYKLFFLQC